MRPDTMAAVMRLLGLGWYVATSLVLGVVGGVWLDGKWGTEPLFTLLGLALGLVASFWGFYKMVEPLIRSNKKPDGRQQ